MANTLRTYNETFFANEALIQLEKELGLANRVHRGYDRERRTFGKGSTIEIRGPGTFTAQDAPSSTGQSIDPRNITLTLNNWRDVVFSLTDEELAYTRERIIDEHIRPAAVTLTDDIDQKLATLYQTVPHHFEMGGTDAVADIVNTRKVMRDNSVPLRDGPSRNHWMLDSATEALYLQNAGFTQQQGAGDAGVSTQRTGTLAEKYGLEFFVNQNAPTHTSGTLTDAAGTIATASVKNTDTTLDVAAVDVAVKAGDSVTVVTGGTTYKYAVTADFTDTSGIVSISPKARVAHQIGDVVTFVISGNATYTGNMVFHRNAFAFAMAPLQQAAGMGARIATITDPLTGLSIRSAMWWEGKEKAIYVSLDVLYGFTTLDPDLAVIAEI